MNNRIRLAALMLIALLYGLAYALIVPIWQAPDEPMLYEYAALVAELGRVPRIEDRSPLLEQRLAESLARQRFWHYRIAQEPAEPPRTLDGVMALFPMPRQVGGDPPLYFVLAALPLRLAAGWLPEHQVLLLRLLNILLLPCMVACAYGAARELVTDNGRPTTDNRPSDKEPRTENREPNFVTLSPCHLPLAVATLVAFHPMLTVIGASLSNDSLASLLGAALCWAILRLIRCGATPRRVALIAGLLALGLLTKRTMLPYLPLLLVLGLGWALLRRRPTTGDRRPMSYYPVSLSPCHLVGPQFSGSPRGHPVQRFSILAMVLLLLIWGARQFDYQSTAGWVRYGTWESSGREWPTSPELQFQGAVRRLATGTMDIQPLPAVGADMLRGRTMRFGARIWSDAPARGRLLVYSSGVRREWPFEVDGALSPEVTASIGPNTRGVWVGIAADSGWFYADDLWAAEQDRPNNMLLNGGSDMPALVAGSPFWPLARYLRLPELAWVLASGHIADPLPYGGEWANLLFASFWGQFGWMDVSLVLGSFWMPLLVLVCLLGGAGLLRWLLWRRAPPWQRRQIWLMLILVLIAILLPVVNAYTVPLREALQQGRYLFPALVPVAILLAFGQSALVPSRWQRGWLWLWASLWLAFSIAALLRLWVYYHG